MKSTARKKKPKKENHKKQGVSLKSKPELSLPQVRFQGKPIFDDGAVKVLKEALMPPERTPLERNWISELSCIAKRFLDKKPVKKIPTVRERENELKRFIDTLVDLEQFDSNHPELYADLALLPVEITTKDAQRAFIMLSEGAQILHQEANLLRKDIEKKDPSKGGRTRGVSQDPYFTRLLRELLDFYVKYAGNDEPIQTAKGQLNKNMTNFIRTTLDYINRHCADKKILYSLDSRARSTALNTKLKRLIGKTH